MIDELEAKRREKLIANIEKNLKTLGISLEDIKEEVNEEL